MRSRTMGLSPFLIVFVACMAVVVTTLTQHF